MGNILLVILLFLVCLLLVILLFLVCLLAVVGVFHKITRSRLLKLELGMGKEQVIKVMGKPALTNVNAKGEIWYYPTSFHFLVEDSPLQFVDNKLVCWGTAFMP